jgi:DNA modification methylase
VPEDPVTQVGDLWLLGKHRVLCGDCTKAEDVGRVMQGKKADCVLTDPPYGINVIGGSKSFGSIGGSKSFGSIGGSKSFGSIGGSKIVKVNKYAPIQGDNKAFDPTFLLSLSENILIFGGNYFANKLPNSRCWLVWDKKGKEWDDDFSDCELIWTTFDKPAKIYRHTWMGMVQEGKREERVHPTQKPVGLYADILKDFGKENDIIADFFLGSGTTLIAAEVLNRICYGIEIEPRYVDVILERYYKLTGNDPVRQDGKKWSELKSI